MRTLRFAALGVAVEVAADDPAALARLDALTCTFARAADAPRHRYRLEVPRGGDARAFRDGELLGERAGARGVVALFESDLYARVIASCGAPLLLHAAAVSDGERALLVAGPSGAGKSTLALALVARGLEYLTDELVAVGADGCAAGLARPMAFDGDPLGAIGAGFFVVKFDQPRDGAPGATRTLVAPPRDRVGHAPRPVGGVLYLRRAEDARPGVRRMSSGEAMLALWPQCKRDGAEALRALAALVARHAVYELTTPALDAAADDAVAFLRDAGLSAPSPRSRPTSE